MAQVINTNIASLNAQRNLNSSQSQLQTSLTRLSSGLRVNSAKDDAAGLAIAERFTTQIKGLNVASRNANDAFSLSQTAEGAMAEIGNNLQRIRELAVQSSNYTNSEGDREALNNEVQQLINEIDRVANQTDFNGTKLLDGSFTGALFQIGANSGQTISINNIVNANTERLGGQQFDQNRGITLAGGLGEGDAIKGFDLRGIEIEGFESSGTPAEDAAKLAANINAKLDDHGVYAKVNDAKNGVDLIAVRADQGTYAALDATDPGLVMTDAGQWDTEALGTTSLEAQTRTFADGLDISTFEGAQKALEIASAALTEVNTARSEMGAVQNRFESVIANLATASENLSASRSRIEDADFAAETAALTRGQILQQAGTAMLAQANSLPQSVLSLLQ